MNLVVVGCGYVGLTNALGFAKLGHRVACMDTDAGKVAKLDVGEMPFFEPGMKELLREMQEKGRVMFTTELAAVIDDAEAAMVCVGTPPGVDGEPDLTQVFAAADAISECLTHHLVLIVKSTVPVGTAQALRDRFEQAGKGDMVEIVSVPDFPRSDRVVIGCDDGDARVLVDQMHAGIDAPKFFMSNESAELAKYAANAFLATKISFANEIAALCERTGADLRDVADALGNDPLIGPETLRPGKRFVEMVERMLGGLKGRRLAVWGLADLEPVRFLYALGADVCAYDPKAGENARRILPDAVGIAPTAVDACDGAEALIVLTDWNEFRDVSFDTVRERLIEPRVFDGRNLLADVDLKKHGFQYYGVGISR